MVPAETEHKEGTLIKISPKDIVGAQAIVTAAFNPWGEPVYVGAEMVRAFAELTGDRNPIHISPEAGLCSIFQRCVAHGKLIESLALGHRPPPTFEVVGTQLVLTEARSRFSRPVAVGQHVAFRERVSKVEAQKRTGDIVVTFEWQCRIEDTGKIAVEGEIILLHSTPVPA